jgi:hypothetical protein
VTLRAASALALAILLVALVVGCGAETVTQQVETAGPPSITETAVSSPGVTATPPDIVPQATSPELKALDPSGVGTELGAMEKELDQMDMPSDADFSDAEGALY